ncbi:MAG: right-handed parallel beta-helix repeat-containing protein [Candidatus Sabulitectum sp.]|nr:right-handed parallel beta-helix repeat-containing protein [Candidatus Sabulitectum sp.]
MRSILAVAAISVFPVVAFSQTVVSGDQSGVWAMAGSPYQVVGEIVIPAGLTLAIEPGVEVNFQGHYKFTVNGSLQAIGSEADSIFFTTDDITTGWGGIRVDSDDVCTLSFCRIEYGKTSGDYPDIHGGGLALLSSDAAISNCVFADNDATGNDNGMGGAVYAYSTEETTFTDCIFTENHAYGEGGAIKFTGDLNTEITGCEFLENDCLYGGGAISGYMIYGTTITSSLFAENYTMYSNGGAINTLGAGNTLYLINCTISGNSAVTGDGGGIDLAYAIGYFVNTIVFDNPGMYSNDLYLDYGGSAEAYYCDLDMSCGATGTNNFYEDPQFIDPDNFNFNLLATSACIDTGIAFFVLNGDTLVDLSPEQYYGSAPDVGAFEFTGGSGVGDSDLFSHNGLMLHQNSPNPFYSSTTISYELNQSSFVSLRVYDLSGREVRTLVDGEEASGLRSVVWSGSSTSGKPVPAGTYIIRLSTDRCCESIKAILVN